MRYGAAWLVMLLGVASTSAQQYQWSGGAGSDESWGTAANWTNSAVPPALFTGRIAFTNLDLGSTNVMESDRTISGPSMNASYGLIGNVNGPAGITLGHVIDLNGNVLTLNGGTVQVGRNASNSLVEIRNGTLKMGDSNRVDVYIGYMTVDKACSNARWVVSGTVNATNLGSIIISRNAIGNTTYTTPQGVFDLSGATINRGATPNALYLFSDLMIGWNSGDTPGANPFGRLLLPASLRQLDVRDLILGYLRDGYGTLDFGSSSSLTGLTVRGNLSLARESARGQLVNLPPNVAIRVGSPGAPGVLHIGTYQYNPAPTRQDIAFTWVPTGGTFNAYLSQLVVGRHFGGNAGTAYGKLDLRQTSVAFDGVVNRVCVPFMNIGSRDTVAVHYGGGRGEGYLHLPASVTNITAGTLAVGYCSNTRGWIDIGNSSSLQTLWVTNALLMGPNGRIGRDQAGTVTDYLPPGVTVQVGSATRTAKLHVGVRGAGQWPSYGELYGSGRSVLRITNGIFRGYLSELKVAAKEDSTKVVTGIVDLAGASVPMFNIVGHAFIGAENGTNFGGAVPSGNRNAYGYVHLPTCTVNVASNLYIGDTNTSSLGLLDLNGTEFRVAGGIFIDTTGVVTSRVNGASAGLHFLGADTNTFTVAAAGRIKVHFTADPADPEENCWGLRMSGNVTNLFRSWTNAPARLTWNLSGLNPGLQSVFGIQYDAIGNYTYVGLPGVPRGAVFMWY